MYYIFHKSTSESYQIRYYLQNPYYDSCNNDDKIGIKKNEENTQILRGSVVCLYPLGMMAQDFHYHRNRVT